MIWSPVAFALQLSSQPWYCAKSLAHRHTETSSTLQRPQGFARDVAHMQITFPESKCIAVEVAVIPDETPTLDTLDFVGNNKTDAEKDLPFANQHGSGTWVHACFHNVTAMVSLQTLSPREIDLPMKSVGQYLRSEGSL